MNSNAICSLCLAEKQIPVPEIINLSCEHKVCPSCFPYFVFPKLIETGMDYFQKENIECYCLKCKKPAKATITESNLLTLFTITKNTLDLTNQKNSKKILCEACEESKAIKYCYGCAEKYCEECFDGNHLRNKLNKNHRFEAYNYEEDFPASYAKCMNTKCESIKNIKDFCKTCKKWTCKTCIGLNHKEHEFISLENMNFINSHNFIAKSMKDQEKLEKEIQDLMENEKNDCENHFFFIEELIKKLTEIKEQAKLKIKEKQFKIHASLQIFKNSSVVIGEELRNFIEIPKYKQIYLREFCKESYLISKKNFERDLSPDFCSLTPCFNEYLKDIKKTS